RVDPANLTVEAIASSKPEVAQNVTITGTGAKRTVAVTPAGARGITDITLRVTGQEGKTNTTVLHYAVSTLAPGGSTVRFHTGGSDFSSALDVGDGYMLVADDERNDVRLYQRDVSGPPVKTWDFGAQLGNPLEIDMEAMTRVGDTLYWDGSMGNG